MKPAILILISLLNFQILFAQSDCNEFDSYDDSQLWITKINALAPEARRSEILNRMQCEQELGDSVRFGLIALIEGVMVTPWPSYRNELIELIDANNLILTPSLCEVSNIYPQKCNLGFLIISGTDQPVYSNISSLEPVKIKRNKKRILLILKSREWTQISAEVSALEDKEVNQYIRDVELKKGKNRISLPVEDGFYLVEVRNNTGRLLIIK